MNNIFLPPYLSSQILKHISVLFVKRYFFLKVIRTKMVCIWIHFLKQYGSFGTKKDLRKFPMVFHDKFRDMSRTIKVHTQAKLCLVLCYHTKNISIWSISTLPVFVHLPTRVMDLTLKSPIKAKKVIIPCLVLQQKLNNTFKCSYSFVFSVAFRMTTCCTAMYSMYGWRLQSKFALWLEHKVWT